MGWHGFYKWFLIGGVIHLILLIAIFPLMGWICSPSTLTSQGNPLELIEGCKQVASYTLIDYFWGFIKGALPLGILGLIFSKK